jgi:hypothetical protein
MKSVVNSPLRTMHTKPSVLAVASFPKLLVDVTPLVEIVRQHLRLIFQLRTPSQSRSFARIGPSELVAETMSVESGDTAMDGGPFSPRIYVPLSSNAIHVEHPRRRVVRARVVDNSAPQRLACVTCMLRA